MKYCVQAQYEYIYITATIKDTANSISKGNAKISFHLTIMFSFSLPLNFMSNKILWQKTKLLLHKRYKYSCAYLYVRKHYENCYFVLPDVFRGHLSYKVYQNNGRTTQSAEHSRKKSTLRRIFYFQLRRSPLTYYTCLIGVSHGDEKLQNCHKLQSCHSKESGSRDKNLTKIHVLLS